MRNLVVALTAFGLHPRLTSRRHRWLALIAFFLGALAANAASVRWESDPSAPNAVQLIFEDCAPEGDLALPQIPGATLTFLGQSQSTNIVNFTVSSSVTNSYVVRARQSAPVQIPAFSVKTNKGVQRVAAFTVGAPAASLDAVASSHLTPEKTSVWVGEVFGLTYELSASRRNNPQINETFDWNPAPLVAEDWSKPTVTESVAGNDRRVQATYRTRAYAKVPNQLKLEAASHLLTIQTGTVGFGFLSQPRMEPVSVTSDQPTIEVKPLPVAPAGFSGAVGQFKLTSKVVPEKASIGEPVTWTLELTGTGNWPEISGLPQREVSKDFQVVQPKAKRTTAEGKLFDATLTEDVVLVPEKAGDYTLGPVAFSYFDPKSGTYRTISAPPAHITIAAPSAPQITIPGATAQNGVKVPPEPSTQAEPSPAAAAPATPPRPAAAPAPDRIPRDPLVGTALAPLPLTWRQVASWCTLPVPLLIGWWAWLAFRRAAQTDPLRPRREAYARLGRTLAHMASASATDRPAILLAWQRDAALLWGIGQAAPRAEVFAWTAANNPGVVAPAEVETWAALWRDADRALYASDGKLPADWLARALEAHGTHRVPGLKLRRLLLTQNLFPFAAVLIAGLVIAGASQASEATAANPAADAASAYRRADFAAAEKVWRADVAARPTDAFARHNLSLALSQQERLGEAAAQAAAAFVQSPGEPAIRWQFAYAADKSHGGPAPLAALLNGGPLPDVALRASPSEWQRILICSAWAAAVAIGWMLFNAYHRRSRVVLLCAAGALALSVLLGGAAVAGITSYGLAADGRAVVVARGSTLRSIPTEADTTQKTSPLSPGGLALAEKTFLANRWVRLAFENGQTGWVRAEDVVPLWHGDLAGKE